MGPTEISCRTRQEISKWVDQLAPPRRGLGSSKVAAVLPSRHFFPGLAAATAVPVVFVIDDVEALPGSFDLARLLGELVERHPTASVVRVGPERFGLHYDSLDELRSVVRTTLRLRRDPHANAKQHALLARTIKGYLEERGLLKKGPGSP